MKYLVSYYARLLYNTARYTHRKYQNNKGHC